MQTYKFVYYLDAIVDLFGKKQILILKDRI